MKKLLIIFIILSSCSTPQSRSNEYYETVIGHIIQTVLSGECNSKCINSIVSSDLKYATYSQAMYVLILLCSLIKYEQNNQVLPSLNLR